MFIRNLVVITLLFISASALAQNGFDRGFIIDVQGDTTFGYVQYKAIKSQDRILRFRTEKEEEAKDYTSGDIKGFGSDVLGYFQSMDLSDIEVFGGPAFMRILIEGKLSLYKSSKGYLLVKNGLMDFLLTKPQVEVQRTEVLVVEQNMQIKADLERDNRNTVARLISDGCDSLILEENPYKTSDKSLIRIVSAYNDCVNAGYKNYEDLTERVILEISLVAGVSSSILAFDGNPENRFTLFTNFDPVKSLILGSEITYSVPQLTNKFHALLGAHYQKTNYYGYAVYPRGSDLIHYDDVFIDISMLRLPIGIGYRPNFEVLPVSFYFGVTVNYFLKADYLRVEERVPTNPSFGDIETSYRGALNDDVIINDGNPGVWVGMAFQKKITDKFGLTANARYESIRYFTDSSAKLGSFQILFGIVF